MVPTVLVKIDEFPMTTNGKVDKKNLPKSNYEEISENKYVEPRTEVESKLARIWSEVLHIDKVGVKDNFFRIGGHSLSVIKLVNKIIAEFGVKLKIQDIFVSSTIDGQANLIERSSNKSISSYNIVKTEKQEYYHVSSAQKRLFLLYQIEGVSSTYNMPGIIEAYGKLDLEKLNKSFIDLLDRHEVLRTTLHLVNDEVVQKVHETDNFDIFKIIDMRNEFNKEEKINEMAEVFFSGFKLEELPLIRMNIVWLEDERYDIYINMHHVISDGESMNILIRDFVSLYNDEQLEPLEIQYKDFSEYQQSIEYKELLQKQKEYWVNKFKGDIPLLNISTDYIRTSVRDFNGKTLSMNIDKNLYNL